MPQVRTSRGRGASPIARGGFAQPGVDLSGVQALTEVGASFLEAREVAKDTREMNEARTGLLAGAAELERDIDAASDSEVLPELMEVRLGDLKSKLSENLSPSQARRFQPVFDRMAIKLNDRGLRTARRQRPTAVALFRPSLERNHSSMSSIP